MLTSTTRPGALPACSLSATGHTATQSLRLDSLAVLAQSKGCPSTGPSPGAPRLRDSKGYRQETHGFYFYDEFETLENTEPPETITKTYVP